MDTQMETITALGASQANRHYAINEYLLIE